MHKINWTVGVALVAAVLATILGAAGLCRGQTTPPPSADSTLTKRTEHYDRRYGLVNVDQKRTDNRGEGFDALYGTRNFRVVLKGVVYRGGANNKWHRSEPRSNANPLPDDGLRNLCVEGFRHSYYLYESNFDTAPDHLMCETAVNNDHSLRYFQMSSIDDSQTYELLSTVYETVKDPSLGPIYIHCWNGWHASGRVAAKILRQFCGLSAEEAVEYWDANTDGNNREKKYESIRKDIREFSPYREFEITEKEAALICPK